MFLRISVNCTLIVSTLLGLVLGKQCPYRNSFSKISYHWCDTGCCGDHINSYCCTQRHLGAIVLGSVVGAFIVIVIIAVIIHCCYKRRRQNGIEYRRVTRNYGTISVPDAAERYKSVEVVNPAVGITITPASPEALLPQSRPPLHERVEIIVGSGNESFESEEEIEERSRLTFVTFVEEPEVIEPEPEIDFEIMGNENRPAGHVENDVEPYRPDQPAGAVDSEPYYPDNQYRPDTEPYQPYNQPDTQPYPSNTGPYGPPAGMAGGDDRPYPDNQPYGADTTPYPSGDPYPAADDQPFSDTQPYESEPAGFAGDNEGYQPDDQPYREDTEPYGDDNQPY